MKARLPKGYGGGGQQNFQALARQAQKMQDDMAAATEELNQKEYESTSGGGMVKAVVSGEMELKSIEINQDVVDPDDVEMLSDLIMAAVNGALKSAATDRDETMEKISGGMNIPGLGGMF